ncbi:MAG: aminodeoxychorismate synthase component I [Thiotrichales bacterium]|jgi:anthranilate synthase component 1|nr:aminodeoxychorismate synthase component I [Thiotrichales bacterium]
MMLSSVVQSRHIATAFDCLALHRANPERYPALLCSASGQENGHRYDILFADLQPASLDALSHVDMAQSTAHDLPFIGGYFFFFPYEYAQQIEPSLVLPDADQWQPQVWQVGAAFIWDRQTNTLSLVAQQAQADQMAVFWQDVDALADVTSSNDRPIALSAKVTESAPEPFLSGVQACKDYILAGDVFQVNLSRSWQAALDKAIRPVDVFTQLREANPAPFSALLVWDEQAIISSSPERLVSVRNGRLATRPIAGTRRRDANDAADAALKSELRLHPKEQAEHVMLIDLERNDLGRVCIPGSIHVDELMTIESYTHVHHIVSNVVGQVRPGTSAKQVIDAVFPGGTITGCPKVRCMEIIAALEQTPRGVYTGSLGYVSLDGQMDSNILIRSFYWQPGQLSFRAGAGIVYDSQPEAELSETRHKAKGLVRALMDTGA